MDEPEEKTQPAIIKHLVISGGGATGLAYYGILRESNKSGFWNMSDIKTIHATSIGTYLMVFLPIVNIIGWDSADDFLIKRPWEKIFELTTDNILKSYNNIGVFNREIAEISFKPMLDSVDLSLNITLREFYEFSGIEMHWYTTNLDEYRLEDVSYKTHPDWTVIDATYCSSALPIMFRPGNVNGVFYADGALFCNYPIVHCISLAESIDSIFAIYKFGDYAHHNNEKREEYKNMFDYLFHILSKSMEILGRDGKPLIKNSICVNDSWATIYHMINSIKSSDSRMTKIKEGEIAWNDFVANTN